MYLPFSGRRALVTGGTGGIGRALCLALAERGAAITVSGGSSPEKLESLLRELAKKAGRTGSGNPGGFLCGIGKDFTAEQAAAFILDKEPDPDLLICAWGPFQKASLQDTGPELWRFLTESNLIFPGIMVSRVIGGMIARGWGRILLFGGTGTAEIQGYTGTAAYSAAKTALGVLAKSAAKAAAGKDLTCNVICPGFTDTEYCDSEDLEYNRRHSPGGKSLKPEDIARFCLAILENPERNGEALAAGREEIPCS